MLALTGVPVPPQSPSSAGTARRRCQIGCTGTQGAGSRVRMPAGRGDPKWAGGLGAGLGMLGGLGDTRTMPSSPHLDAQLLPAEPAKQILRQLGEQGELARLLAPAGWVEGAGGCILGCCPLPNLRFFSFLAGRAQGKAGTQGGLGCLVPPCPGTLLAVRAWGTEPSARPCAARWKRRGSPGGRGAPPAPQILGGC